MDLLISFTHDSELQALNNAAADFHTLQITTRLSLLQPALSSLVVAW
jgi:hypothetical protein